MKKIYFVIVGGGVIILILIISIILLQSGSKKELSSRSVTPTRSVSPVRDDDEDTLKDTSSDIAENSERNKEKFSPQELSQEDIDKIMEIAKEQGNDPEEVLYYLEHQIDHYDEEFDEDDPLEMVELIDFPKEQIITLDPMPVYMYQPYEDGFKISPDKTYASKIQSNTLILSNVQTNEQIQSIQLTEGTKQATHAWLTNDLLMLIEKEDADTGIDRAYMIERETGDRTYLVGSFPVYTRFDLETNPQVYNNGAIVIMTDNEGELWKIEIRY